MGILRQGIFGGFEKKIGGLVGRKVNGKNLISPSQHKMERVRTNGQLDQQIKFELVVSVLKWFTDFIAMGFKDVSGRKKSFDMALKYNFKRIVTGSSPFYTIDYSQLAYSRGTLSGAHGTVMNRTFDALELSWLRDVQTRFNRSTDKASFVIFCPEREVIMKYLNRSTRAVLSAVLPLLPGLEEATLHVWMSFASADGKMVSNSVYLGTI
jgi:hypothetical protein